MNISALNFLSLFPIAFIAISCGQQAQKEMAYNLPDRPTHKAEEIFEISQVSENSFLTYIWNLHILSNGNVIVQEPNATRLLEISSDGKSSNIIGRKGRGPGEFSGIWSIVVTPDDTLHVYERNAKRHHVLTKSGQTQNWVSIREIAIKNNYYGRSFMYDFPKAVYPDSTNGYLVLFNNFFTPYDTTTKLYSFMDETDFNLIPTKRKFRKEAVWDVVIARKKGVSVEMNDLPEFKRTFYLYESEKKSIFLIQNHSNAIKIQKPEGENEVIGHLPFQHVPLSQERKEDILSPLQDYEQPYLDQVESKLLRHEPYYNTVLLNNGLLWVNLYRKESNKPNWVVTTLQGEIVKAFSAPEHLELVKIHEDKLCGVQQKNSNPTIICYRVTSINY